MLNNFAAVLNTAGEKEPILLENLLFSLNMSLPLFIVMGLGCILTHKGFFTENYIAHTTNLVYYVLLPGKMFLDIATSDLSTAFDIRYVAVATGGVVLQFALAWAAGWRVRTAASRAPFPMPPTGAISSIWARLFCEISMESPMCPAQR